MNPDPAGLVSPPPKVKPTEEDFEESSVDLAPNENPVEAVLSMVLPKVNPVGFSEAAVSDVPKKPEAKK